MPRPSDLSAVLAKIDAEIAELQRTRDYLTNAQPATVDAPERKARKPRKKRGLPEDVPSL